MKSFSYKSVFNQCESGSTAFILDLRNSTKITRKISWDGRLPKHVDFMMSLHKHVYESIYNCCSPEEFAMNDTGDGYLCIFWDKVHALTCLKIAIFVKDFLDDNLTQHNDVLSRQYNDPIEKLDYAFGIHSGGSTVNRATISENDIVLIKDFIFGIVVNTSARLESFTKNYIGYKFLVSGNFKDVFLEQATTKKLESLFSENSNYCRKSLGRVNINDGKDNGHNIYALEQEFIDIFRDEFMG